MATPSFCTAAPDTFSAQRLVTLGNERGDLTTRVAVLEAELARTQCVAEEPPRSVVTPPTSAQPGPESGDPDPDLFNRRDLSAMDGCWQLMTQFDVRNVRTGAITTYNQWDVCFDPADPGAGTEVMRATNGTICEGSVSGTFDSAGQFEIDKPDDLACSDGSEIYRTIAACNLNAAGRANCNLRQPATGGTERVELRRSSERP